MAIRIIDKTATTVKELRELLSEIPDDYKVSLSGMNGYAVAVDDENKSILLDDPKWIEEDVYCIEEGYVE